MNILEIKKLIIKIGEFDAKIDDQKSQYLLNGKNMTSFNLNDISAFKNEFNEKLKKQLYNKSDITMLLGLNDDLLIQLKNLQEIYRIFRIKLAKSKDEEISKVYKQVCQIITAKINALDEIQDELIPIINNFDYKLDSDFNTSISQNLETPFEDKESETGILKDRIDNPFPNIFRNYDAYQFFEKLKENICIDQTTQLADYSYVYRKMLQDKFINDEVSPSSFVSFLDKNYTIVLDPLKSWGKLTGKHRVMLYEILKTKSS
tara:strand:- start:15526 stop:16308 length:783 start_codon:yes stop_codon:yes gene_type:complete